MALAALIGNYEPVIVAGNLRDITCPTTASTQAAIRTLLKSWSNKPHLVTDFDTFVAALYDTSETTDFDVPKWSPVEDELNRRIRLHVAIVQAGHEHTVESGTIENHFRYVNGIRDKLDGETGYCDNVGRILELVHDRCVRQHNQEDKGNGQVGNDRPFPMPVEKNAAHFKALKNWLLEV